MELLDRPAQDPLGVPGLERPLPDRLEQLIGHDVLGVVTEGEAIAIAKFLCVGAGSEFANL